MIKALPKRSEANPAFTWRLQDIFATDDDWQRTYDELLTGIKDFAVFEKIAVKSAENLHKCLSVQETLSQKAGCVYVYAHMHMHEDNANTFYQGLADKADALITKLGSAFSFLEPAILTLSAETLEHFMSAVPELKLYAHFFDNILRRREHVLSPEIEAVLAASNDISQAAHNIFSMLNNADMKFGSVTDPSGNEVELSHGRFITFMEHPDREFRKKVFEQYYQTFISHKNTLAAAYNASVKKDCFYSEVRKYPSAMGESLFANAIPEEVYTNLIETIHEYLPVMHEYVRLRKQMLGLDELHMYDIYVPIVSSVDTDIPYSEAKQQVTDALAALGQDYLTHLEEGFNGHWIDVYENQGKESGAYAWGSYGTHPYVLLNYDNKINDMFTLAHEMGHALHTFYTYANQPFIYGDYSTFLAEVASTVNEALLMEHMRKTCTDKHMQAYLINYFLDQFRTTVFRQTMFAEFEMITHRMVENGEPLTSESLCKVYRDLNELYYGPDMVVDSQIDMEWSRIPHFYSAYYVFQYATGFSAAMSFAELIRTQGTPAVEKYIGFLKSGSSDYPINVLKNAGLDMSSPQPVRTALDLFKELVERMKSL